MSCYILRFLAALSLIAGSPLFAGESAAQKRPNVLLIMADDMGYETLGCYGGASYATPNLDKLAQGGLKFTNCFSTPKCSPSRVTIMTGRYTFRTTTTWGHIPKDEITFGKVLSDADYKTALAGKWQMTLLKDDPGHVQTMGFQESAVWAWHEGPRYWKPMIYRNDRIMKGTSGRYGPDLYVEFLVDFMKKNNDTPFFAYYPMCLPHYPKKGEPQNPDGKWESYKEMVEIIDKKVGELVAALEKAGLRKNTLILFTADNGTPTNVTSKLGKLSVRGGKAKLTDAGTRVPLIANWPGVTPANASCEDLIDFSDFMPTLAELAEAKLPKVTLDGTSFAAQIKGKKCTPRTWVYTEFSGKAWIRNKDWKLYRSGTLFDMKNDPLEKRPLSKDDKKGDDARKQLQPILDKLK